MDTVSPTTDFFKHIIVKARKENLDVEHIFKKWSLKVFEYGKDVTEQAKDAQYDLTQTKVVGEDKWGVEKSTQLLRMATEQLTKGNLNQIQNLIEVSGIEIIETPEPGVLKVWGKARTKELTKENNWKAHTEFNNKVLKGEIIARKKEGDTTPKMSYGEVEGDTTPRTTTDIPTTDIPTTVTTTKDTTKETISGNPYKDIEDTSRGTISTICGTGICADDKKSYFDDKNGEISEIFEVVRECDGGQSGEIFEIFEVVREFGPKNPAEFRSAQIDEIFKDAENIGQKDGEISKKFEVVREFPSRLTIPKGGLSEVVRKLTEESEDGCPLDYVDGGKMVYFNAGQGGKFRKFDIFLDAEIILIFFSKIVSKGLYRKSVDFVPVHRSFWKSFDNRYKAHLNWLVRHDFIEIDDSYSAGNLTEEKWSKGYRIKNVTEFEEYEVKSPKLMKKMSQPIEIEVDTVTEAMKNKVSSFSLNLTCAEGWVDLHDFPNIQGDDVMTREQRVTLQRHIEKIKLKKLTDLELVKGSMHRTPIEDVGGRLMFRGRSSSLMTSMPSSLRKSCVKLNGEGVDELDIRCAQPSFLATIFAHWNFSETDLRHFPWFHNFSDFNSAKDDEISTLNDVLTSSETDFYLYFTDRWKEKYGTEITRSEMKVKMYGVMFANKYQLQPDMTELFSSTFPILFNFIFELLRCRRIPLWKVLQGLESTIVLDNMVPRILSECPEVDFFTVHDSIVFPKSAKPNIEKIFYSTLDLFGIPRVK